MTSDLSNNPFAVQTPEGISAEDVLSLFVEDFADFYQVLRIGHTFLNGARGSGKSMIFRFLEPDCQILKTRKPLHDLDFISFYIPVKETELKLTELARLENKHGSLVLNEHLMAVNVITKVVATLRKLNVEENPKNVKAFEDFITGPMTTLLRRGGWEGKVPDLGASPTFESMRQVSHQILEDIYAEVARYLQRISFATDLSYRGSLFGFLDFVRPFLLGLRKLPFMPNGPVFLLIDDADNLSLEQTKILNTWVSIRGSAELSLKVSTQKRYKTYRTVTGPSIETPHDFAEVEISDVYTSSKERYSKRIHSIVMKRLQLANINATADSFFPPDQEQSKKISAIAAEIRLNWETSGKGARARDDAYRYARPNFIRNLHGTAKSGSTYSYAGFDQLVHLSSGIVRYFLEPAALMYGQQVAENGTKPTVQIRPHIQDGVIRAEANKFLEAEFERITNDDEIEPGVKDRATKLRNLIDSLGALFHTILMSDAAERRVFSIAFSNGPDNEVRDVFALGIEYGYFHKSTIGKKEGAGRTALYILSRRLAPVFNLDPTSFSGYKFITNDVARLMIESPKTFHNQLRTRPLDEIVDPAQGSLFGEA